MMSLFYKRLYKTMEVTSVLFLAGMVVVVSIVVIGRYVFNSTPAWGEEIGLFCMVWFALLSAASGIFDNCHIRVTILSKFLSKRAAEILDLLVNMFLLGIFGFLIYNGILLVVMTQNSLMGGSGIPFMYLNAAVPVSALCMVFAVISKYIK
jgi:TRAP-type C4-dicarboxylate transport system permease small subunit